MRAEDPHHIGVGERVREFQKQVQDKNRSCDVGDGHNEEHRVEGG